MCVSFGLSVSNTHVAEICGPALQQKQTAIQQGPNVHLAGTCHTDTKRSQTGPRVRKFNTHSSEALSRPSADEPALNQGLLVEKESN